MSSSSVAPELLDTSSCLLKTDPDRKDARNMLRVLFQFIPKLAEYGILVEDKLQKTFEITETKEIKTSGRLELVSGNKFRFPSMAFPNNEGDKIKVWVEMRIYPDFSFDKSPAETETPRCQITFWQQEFRVEKAECLSSIEIPLSKEQTKMLWE